LTRTRLVFPNELRDDLLAYLRSAPLS
jgi:hypothetical protein